ncbi:MFS transporter [Paenibacillus amylolyticus]|nr:MFS transporter [Paenibacillus amylolyticus]
MFPVRLSQDEIDIIDQLVFLELAKNRSDATAMLIREGIRTHQTLLNEIREYTAELERVKAKIQQTIRDSGLVTRLHRISDDESVTYEGEVREKMKNEIRGDSYRAVLRLPSFVVLLVGRLISGAGQILFSMATMWYILQLTESALAAALIPMLPYLIYAFLGIPLATISDRLPKKQLLIWTDILRAGIACILAILFMTGSMLPWHIYAANLLIAILGFLFNPATQTVIPAILPEPAKQLAPANALLNSSSKTIELLGYALGGILIALISVQSILFIYAVTFLLSAISIFLSASL